MTQPLLGYDSLPALPFAVPDATHQSFSGLDALDYVVVVAYLVVTAGIVFWASRKQHDAEDFFLGSRRMPWLAVGLSIMATLLSSLTYLGLTGEVVKNGIAAFMMQGAIIPAAMIVIPIFIPFFMRLRFTSAYEYLEHRFDYRARLLGGALFLGLRAGWVSLVMYSGSLALAKMINPQAESGSTIYGVILVLGLFATLYTCFGGLAAVIWTDVLQAVMLFGGALAIVVYVWLDAHAGPVAWWQAVGRFSPDDAAPAWFSIDPTVRMTLGTAFIAGFFWQVCTHCSDQVVLQRYASTPSLAAARNSYITNVVSALGIAVLLGLSGLALLYYYTNHPERLPSGVTDPRMAGDALMPYFYSLELPVGFGGLILANFLCDAMQTLVSGVNSVTAVATQDVLEHSRVVRSKTHNRLWTARLLTLGLGGLTTLVALGVAWQATHSDKNIFDLMPRTFNMFLGPLGALFLTGMFVPRATGRTATPAILFAFAVSIVWSWWRYLFGTEWELSISWAIAVPCVTGVAAAAILALLFESGDDHHGRRFTWRAVMQRPVPESHDQDHSGESSDPSTISPTYDDRSAVTPGQRPS